MFEQQGRHMLQMGGVSQVVEVLVCGGLSSSAQLLDL